MDMAAEDDAARQRNRAQLYAPPKGALRPAGGGRPRSAARIDPGQARALMAQVAAEDGGLQGRR